jgi:H+/Cl- antiporter ClcA
MELTDNYDFVLPIMAACLLSRTFSSLVCKTPVYREKNAYKQLADGIVYTKPTVFRDNPPI